MQQELQGHPDKVSFHQNHSVIYRLANSIGRIKEFVSNKKVLSEGLAEIFLTPNEIEEAIEELTSGKSLQTT